MYPSIRPTNNMEETWTLHQVTGILWTPLVEVPLVFMAVTCSTAYIYSLSSGSHSLEPIYLNGYVVDKASTKNLVFPITLPTPNFDPNPKVFRAISKIKLLKSWPTLLSNFRTNVFF